MVAWVDDIMVLAQPDPVETFLQDLEKVLTCKCEGSLTEYVGRKIAITWEENLMDCVKFMQPMLVQS